MCCPRRACTVQDLPLTGLHHLTDVRRYVRFSMSCVIIRKPCIGLLRPRTGSVALGIQPDRGHGRDTGQGSLQRDIAALTLDVLSGTLGAQKAKKAGLNFKRTHTLLRGPAWPIWVCSSALMRCFARRLHMPRAASGMRLEFGYRKGQQSEIAGVDLVLFSPSLEVRSPRCACGQFIMGAVHPTPC